MDLTEGLSAIYAIVARSKDVWLLSHETSRSNLDSIMEQGLLPKEQEYRGIRDKVVFATDAKNGEFRNIHKSKEGMGRKDTAYVVFNKPPGAEHIFQYIFRKDPTGLEKVIRDNMIQALKDWFVSTRPIDPDYVALVYGYNGDLLYMREALSH